MNYFKGKAVESLHIPEMVETVRVQGSKQLSRMGQRFPYLNRTLPTKKMSEKQRKKQLKKINRIACWLDNAVPYSPIPLGIDSVLGFIPIIGGSVGGLFSLYQVYLSTTFGIPLWLFINMLANILVDFIFSLIPFAGGFLHMFYKANIYNYEGLREYAESPEYLRREQERNQVKSDNREEQTHEVSPGEITWTQLGMDIKSSVPFLASIGSGCRKSSSKKSH